MTRRSRSISATTAGLTAALALVGLLLPVDHPSVATSARSGAPVSSKQFTQSYDPATRTVRERPRHDARSTAALPAAVTQRRSVEANDIRASDDAPDRHGQSIVDEAVSFVVVNKNDSNLPCPSDRGTYKVRGHLTGPRFDLVGRGQHRRVVTLLLTGWDEGESTWRFTAVPGYDYPYEMAKLGHVSLSIDLLGYGASDKPNGHLVCDGSQADVEHQIVLQLRAGTYEMDGTAGRPVKFSTVLVSAHDAAPLIAMTEASSWGDVDGISTQIFAHQGFTPFITEFTVKRSADCARGGMQADDPKDNPDDPLDDPSRGGGYILFGPPDDQFRTLLFDAKRVDPRVVEAVIAHRNRNPCGQVDSILTALNGDLLHMSALKIPVLLVFPGPSDPVITRDGQEKEAANYGSTDVTTAWMDSGHFMELERCAPDFRVLTANWIHQRWHVGRPTVGPEVGPGKCVTEMRVKGK